MIFHQIPSGGDRNFGYLIGCERTRLGAVIDPSPDPLPCFRKAEEYHLDIIYLVNTHTHFDHTGGNDYFKSRKNSQLVVSRFGVFGDMLVDDGQELSLGEMNLTFIYTPGHTNDCVCIKAGNELMTGDTLFVGKVGGTSTRDAAMKEFESLKKLMELDDNVRVWPGHDYGLSPSSTIGNEKKENPFLLRLNNFEDFIWLKENWADFKLEHGIK